MSIIPRTSYIKNKSNQNLKSGFSLIEIIIAVAIVAVVGAAGFGAFKYLNTASESVVKTKLNEAVGAIKRYQFSVGKYPSSLEDLVNKPQGVSGWDGPYLEEDDIKDKWNEEFEYILHPKGQKPRFEIFSAGNPENEDAKPIYPTVKI